MCNSHQSARTAAARAGRSDRQPGAPDVDDEDGDVAAVLVGDELVVVQAHRDRLAVRLDERQLRPVETGYRPAVAGETVVAVEDQPRVGGQVETRLCELDLAQNRRRTTCGSWSLTWVANSEFTCTMSYARSVSAAEVRMWSSTWLLPSYT